MKRQFLSVHCVVTCRLLAFRLFFWCSELAGSAGGEHGSLRAHDGVERGFPKLLEG